MQSLITRRCAIDSKTQKSLYDTVVAAAVGLGDTNLANHILGETFVRCEPDDKGNIYYQKKVDGTPLVVNFVAEIGSQAQGTHMAAYPPNPPPFWQLPYSDLTSKSHKMSLGLRAPTGAPPELCEMFQNAVAACDAVRAEDREVEITKNERFDITDWVICNEGDEGDVEKMSLVVKLQQTYEVSYDHSSAPRTPRTPRTPRRRITRAGPNMDSTMSDAPGDVAPNTFPEPSERQVGDKYPPSCLIDHRGEFFDHKTAQLVQRNYRNLDNTLIAPPELYATLTEGTLVLITASLVTYIMTGQTTPLGAPKQDRKIYQIIVDKLKVLDHGDGEPWSPPVPSLPKPQTTPKRARDAAADAAFNNFGASLSAPPARRRRTGAAAGNTR